MGKLNSSLILRSVVNAGRNLYIFQSSFSSSVSPFATHIDALDKKPMSGTGKGKKKDRFDSVGNALIVFNKMIGKHPKPSIMEFTKLLAAIVRMKHYAIVVSLSKPGICETATSTSGSEAKPKKKICCAFPKTKKLRDECLVEHGEEACAKWIEAHRICLRVEGFNV
ncbi:hypothetical protein HRI_000034500 [Hibiscus trionum]|uniref:Cytochrome c oxidase copper chaperone n=1 Tax=Hibiscus trionum TaxID=183268 RepID=A0A9W7LGW0_HIBTR|nr:hypothetical protein HRI_000034500 [Hibiscus trionum]